MGARLSQLWSILSADLKSFFSALAVCWLLVLMLLIVGADVDVVLTLTLTSVILGKMQVFSSMTPRLLGKTSWAACQGAHLVKRQSLEVTGSCTTPVCTLLSISLQLAVYSALGL